MKHYVKQLLEFAATVQLCVVCQMFPCASGIVKAEDDAEKVCEHLNTLQSILSDMEQHLTASSAPFLGGFKFATAY